MGALATREHGVHVVRYDAVCVVISFTLKISRLSLPVQKPMKVDERDWTVDRDVSESDEGTRSVGGDADDSV